VQAVQKFKPPTGNRNTDHHLKKFCEQPPKTIAAIDEKPARSRSSHAPIAKNVSNSCRGRLWWRIKTSFGATKQT
jgi:hypothetical protein